MLLLFSMILRLVGRRALFRNFSSSPLAFPFITIFHDNKILSIRCTTSSRRALFHYLLLLLLLLWLSLLHLLLLLRPLLTCLLLLVKHFSV